MGLYGLLAKPLARMAPAQQSLQRESLPWFPGETDFPVATNDFLPATDRAFLSALERYACLERSGKADAPPAMSA